MKLNQPNAEIFVPDGKSVAAALRRVTHLGIGAHQDDLEFMAFHGILECFRSKTNWFGGVVCTNGSGSARSGPYARYTDAQMMEVRRREQNIAASVGRYSLMAQLNYPSSAVKSRSKAGLKEDLGRILAATQPEIVFTHNPADKHDTHVAVAIATIQAIRELPKARRPKRVLGCEVWRSLDWLPDSDKVLMDVSGSENLAAALNGVFDSQIAGGKRYDTGTAGRRASNATFFESHATDKATQLMFGMDLTPLAADNSMDIADYVCGFVRKFEAEVHDKLNRQLSGA